MSFHEQVLANARRDGFLVNLTNDAEIRQSWMEEAQAGGFPFVEIASLGPVKGVHLVSEVSHLPDEVAVKARTTFQLVKIRHPRAEARSVTPSCEYIGPLPMADARALARKIAGLRTPHAIDTLDSGSGDPVPVA